MNFKIAIVVAILAGLAAAPGRVSGEPTHVTAGGAPCISGERSEVRGGEGNFTLMVYATNKCDVTITVTVCNAEKSYNCTQIRAVPGRESSAIFGYYAVEPTFDVDFEEK